MNTSVPLSMPVGDIRFSERYATGGTTRSAFHTMHLVGSVVVGSHCTPASVAPELLPPFAGELALGTRDPYSVTGVGLRCVDDEYGYSVIVQLLMELAASQGGKLTVAVKLSDVFN